MSDIGKEVATIVEFYLNKSKYFQLNAYTFTEVYAFIFFQTDSVLYSRRFPARDEIVDLLYEGHSDYIVSNFKLDKPAEYFQNVFDARVGKYAEMLRGVTGASEIMKIVEKFHFYLYQCSELNEFYDDEKSPLVIGDAFLKFESKVEVTTFYSETVSKIYIKRLNEVIDSK